MRYFLYATIRSMSPEPLAKERLGQHELSVKRVIRQYEQPLLNGLWNTWGDKMLPNGQKRRWFVCNPGDIALSRIVNWITSVPIIADGDRYNQEHLSISPDYFCSPPGSTVQERADHTFLSYFNGKGDVIHIDPTWQLTWGKKKNLTGSDNLQDAIIVRKIPVSDYERVLREEYYLTQFDPTREEERAFLAYHQTSYDVASAYRKYLAQHTDSITEQLPDRTNRYGQTLVEFIRTFIPEWTGIK